MISRRDLLKSGCTLVVGFRFQAQASAQASASGQDAARSAASGKPADPKPVDPKEVDSFLAVNADGTVTVYTGKVDLGTGLRIAIRQMAAEELDLPIDRVTLVEGDTALTPDQGSTGGSTGLTRGGVEVRQAAATARQALLKLPPGQRMSGRFLTKVDPKAPLKDPAQYKVVGEPIPRPDLPAKCTGRHTYVQDFQLPRMLHGRVIRPPAIGAKLMSVDESSIRGIPDVRVVRIANFLGVVAKDEWAAIRAARELKTAWSAGTGLPGSDELAQYVRQSRTAQIQTIVNRGDAAAALESSAKRFSATYFWPNQSHGSIGPSCAVADVRVDGSATIWSSSQGPHGLRQNLSKVFGLPQEKVRVVYLDGAGCYGGNGNEDVAADAVLLSKTVGQPVRVQWMRHDEHGWDPKGPQQLLDLEAGLDSEGHIQAWRTAMWVPAAVPGSRPLLAADAAGIAQDHGQGAGLLTQNADPPYTAANVQVVVNSIAATPLRPSNLRAPGKIANVFAVETFTDELAHAAGLDPLAFRLRGLSDARGVEVLKRVAEMFGWQERPSPDPNAAPNAEPNAEQSRVKIGRGIAYARYKQAENYVALAMEVEVDTATGKISVRRIACAHDCGLVVNPDALKNQIEGCIVQTLSRALHEEVKFDASHVTSVDWASYPILTFPEVPTIEVALINRPELPLLGAGEASCVTVAAALANAVFDATGAKLRIAPFTPQRVKAALA
jgi:nicotinate dehydrogenase subunit B